MNVAAVNKKMQDAPNGLFLLDRELGKRTFTMPVSGAQGSGDAT